MISGIVAHVWQSTLFGIAAWLVALMLRTNRAQARYWVWFTASAKFLVPFACLVAVGNVMPRRAAAPPIRAGWVDAVQELSQPLTLPINDARVPVPARGVNESYIVAIALACWACGFAVVATCWLRRWGRIRTQRNSAHAVKVLTSLEVPVPIMSTPNLIELGVFGIFRPVLLLPEGIAERLNPAELDAILAHEFCHVRRRDNLAAAIHMMVQAVFWFHPLTWWIGARLVDERERACDEEVLRLGYKPKVYAESILRVCKLYLSSPLACVSGVTGSDLKRRIESIIGNRHVVELNFRRKLALGIAGVAALLMPVGMGMLNLHQAGAQEVPDWQTKAGGKMAFEVASIKLSQGKFTPPNLHDLSNTDSQEHTGGYFRADFPLWTYITFAYKIRPTGKLRQETLAHLPKWIETDRYTIEARAPGDPTKDQMRLMMQSLLADRFQLAAHFENQELPVFALVTVKAGKLGPKLLRHADGAPCDTPPSEFGKRYADYPARCDSVELNQNAGIARLGSRDATFEILATAVADFVGEGRPVIDKTGLSGRFDFAMKWMVESEGQPRPDLASMPPDADPSALQALHNQLGLKLESTRALVRTLVIDGVERPSKN